MVGESTKALVCRRCEIVPELVSEEGRGDVVRCSTCGASGNHDVVFRAAQEYLLRGRSHDLIRNFQRRQIRNTRGMKNIRYVPGKLPKLSPPDFIFR